MNNAIPEGRLPVLGILGGMGPLATVDFFGKIVAHTPARTDQEHMPIIIRNVPQVPDRTAAYLSGSDAPWEPLLAGVRMLEAAGIDAIAIPCNSAHLWHGRLSQATRVPILHIGTSAAEWTVQHLPQVRSVGMLATTATVRSRLYHEQFEARGIDIVVPGHDDQQSLVMAGIHAVKAGDVAGARELLTEAAHRLLARAQPAPQALLLGCTEVPIALADAQLPVPKIDSTDTLARACVEWWLKALNTATRHITGQPSCESQ
jgi:aspartate racemase